MEDGLGSSRQMDSIQVDSGDYLRIGFFIPKWYSLCKVFEFDIGEERVKVEQGQRDHMFRVHLKFRGEHWLMQHARGYDRKVWCQSQLVFRSIWAKDLSSSGLLRFDRFYNSCDTRTGSVCVSHRLTLKGRLLDFDSEIGRFAHYSFRKSERNHVSIRNDRIDFAPLVFLEIVSLWGIDL